MTRETFHDHLLLTFTAATPVELDDNAGAAVRGANVNALLNRFCANKAAPTCADCPLLTVCPAASNACAPTSVVRRNRAAMRRGNSDLQAGAVRVCHRSLSWRRRGRSSEAGTAPPGKQRAARRDAPRCQRCIQSLDQRKAITLPRRSTPGSGARHSYRSGRSRSVRRQSPDRPPDPAVPDAHAPDRRRSPGETSGTAFARSTARHSPDRPFHCVWRMCISTFVDGLCLERGIPLINEINPPKLVN